MSLRKPPTGDQPKRTLARFLVLVLLLAVVGVVVWAVVVDQRIDRVENVAASSIELDDPIEVDGLRINVISETGGPIPVVFLHDFDVTGSAMLDGVVAEVGGRFNSTRIDLPGFGLSDRLPEPGPEHTVASLSNIVGTVIEERFQVGVVLVGVGFGGEVAAELAATSPR